MMLLLFLVRTSNRILLTVFLISLACHLKLSAQNIAGKEVRELTVSQFSIEEGLKQSMVSSVLQDSRNLIWMTTGDGLHLFDGIRFTVFTTPINDRFSPSDNLMRTIVEDSPNMFVIASKTGLLYFNSINGQFQIIAQLNDSKVFKLNTQKTIVIWEHSLGFAILDGKTIYPLTLGTEGISIPRHFAPNKICSYMGKTLIIGDKGLIEIDGIPNKSLSNLKAKFFNFEISDILINSKGEPLLLHNGVIYKYLGDGETKFLFDTYLKGKNQFCEDSSNTIWIVNNENKSIHILKDSVLTPVTLIVKHGRIKEDIKPFILSLFEDKEGSIWFGTDGHGALQYQANLLQFHKAEIGFVRAITSTDTSIYAGTFQNGVFQLSPNLNNVKKIDFKGTISTNELLDIETDCKKRLWMATANGIYVADSKFRIVYSKEIRTFRGNLLNPGNGVIQYHTDSCLYEFLGNEKPQLLLKKREMFTTSSGYILGEKWVGTPFGLYKIGTDSDSSYPFYSEKNRLSSYPINSIRIDNSRIWVASTHGLLLFDSCSNRVDLPDELSLLKSENIYALEIDNQNRLWLSTNRGIGCIPSNRDRVIWFDAKNNLQSLEFNSKVSLKVNNMLYFGGINGINALSNDTFNPKSNNGKPILVQLIVADSIVPKGVPSGKITLKLHWDNSSIKGKVSSTSYVAPSNQRYSLFLENYHSSWTDPNSTGDFTFSNLPTGKFTLKAKYSDANGYWSEPTDLISVTIMPPFWKTKWFVTSAAMATLIVSSLIVQQAQRNRYLKKINELERQNALERERGRISRDLHDELGTGLSLIMLNTSLASNEVSSETVQKHLNTISKNSKELYDNMSNLIWLLKSESQTLDNLSARVREKMSEIVEDAGLEYSFKIPESIERIAVSREACRHIFLTIKEAVNNAIKHSNAKIVSININFNNGVLSLDILDNGIGFDYLQNHSKGNGIGNMKQRILQLGGGISIDSTPGSGTRVSITLPKESLAIT